MKSEMIVRATVQDPRILRERREMSEGKTVSELAKVSGLSDLPIPSRLENIMHGQWSKNEASDNR